MYHLQYKNPCIISLSWFWLSWKNVQPAIRPPGDKHGTIRRSKSSKICGTPCDGIAVASPPNQWLPSNWIFSWWNSKKHAAWLLAVGNMWIFQLFRFLGGTVLAAFWLALRRFKSKHPKFLVWDLASGHLPSWIYKSWVPHPHEKRPLRRTKSRIGLH